MHVYEVIHAIYKFYPRFFFKTYSTGYFRKQQNETGYFCGMTLDINFIDAKMIYYPVMKHLRFKDQ